MPAPAQDPLREQSVAHMQAGLALLDRGEWHPAVVHFEQAITLREQLPWREEVLSAWLLAAAWINRSDALRRLGNPALLPEAVRSLDFCIAAMSYVELAQNPAYPERLILAWVNRATTCGEMGNIAEALQNFAEAGRLLEKWGTDVTPSRCFLGAMLSVNRARVFLEARQAAPAWEDARAAIAILARLDSPSASIKACSIQCRALAMLLDEPRGVDESQDWIALATDSTEEALAMVKATGYMDFWVADLVRYGAKIYRVCQPQFLAEFLCDWLIDGPLAGEGELREEMQKELLLAQGELEQRVLSAAHETDYVEGQIRILQSLQSASARLSSEN